jgi:hypothetical protein
MMAGTSTRDQHQANVVEEKRAGIRHPTTADG